jgi:hypothetical protein
VLLLADAKPRLLPLAAVFVAVLLPPLEAVLEALFAGVAPPREALLVAPPRLLLLFEAALLLEVFAPPREADLEVDELLPPRFAAAVLPAAPRADDLEAVFEAPLEAPPRLEDLDAAFDPPLEALLLALFEVPFDAVFVALLDAPFEVDRPPPLDAWPPFFAAAFLVAFAMFNGFCEG